MGTVVCDSLNKVENAELSFFFLSLRPESTNSFGCCLIVFMFNMHAGDISFENSNITGKKDIERSTVLTPTCRDEREQPTSPPAFSFHTAFLGRPFFPQPALSNKNVRKYRVTSFPFSAGWDPEIAYRLEAFWIKRETLEGKGTAKRHAKHHAFILVN